MTVRLAVWNTVPTWMASSQMPAPWLRQVLPEMTVPALMKSLPEPSASMPPPASPAWLSLMVLLLAVNVQGTLTVFSKTTPPPSAVAELPVTVTLFRVRLALPLSRMPPPLEVGPSGLAGSAASPFSTVRPVSVTRNLGVGLAGSKLGLMSKTRFMVIAIDGDLIPRWCSRWSGRPRWGGWRARRRRCRSPPACRPG